MFGIIILSLNRISLKGVVVLSNRYEIAKELTLALIEKSLIRPTNNTNAQTINESIVQETIKAYSAFAEVIAEHEKKDASWSSSKN